MEINLLTDKQLCGILKVTRQTLYVWRKEGLPHIKIGKPIRYEISDVLEWLKERGEM